jgi:leucyl-tRNA synthetase
MQPKEKEQKQEEAKGSNRLAHLREIELSRQKLWKENHVFEADAEENWNTKYDFDTKNKKKYFITFPYPYMNGRLHLGHAFSLSKAEFQSRYQRLQGKNVLFPFGFHCTGMPIAAAAKRVTKEFKEDPDIVAHIKEKIEKKKKKKKIRQKMIKKAKKKKKTKKKIKHLKHKLKFLKN